VAWDWVGTTATAVVGVAGIFGNLWTAGRSSSSQEKLQSRQLIEADKAARRAERKVAYSAFLADALALQELAIRHTAGRASASRTDAPRPPIDPDWLRESLAGAEHNWAKANPGKPVPTEMLEFILTNEEIYKIIAVHTRSEIKAELGVLLGLTPEAARDRLDALTRLSVQVSLVASEHVRAIQRVAMTIIADVLMQYMLQAEVTVATVGELGRRLAALEDGMALDLAASVD